MSVYLYNTFCECHYFTSHLVILTKLSVIDEKLMFILYQFIIALNQCFAFENYCHFIFFNNLVQFI